MFIPFISNDVEVFEKNDMVIVNANLGLRSKHEIRKIIGNDKKANALFTKLQMTGMEFYKFFLPEVIGVLKKLEKLKYPYQVNIKTVGDLIEKLQSITGSKTPHEINFKAINNEMEFKILPHQMKIFERYKDFQENFNYRGMLIDADPGTGKAQPLTSKVLTPNGWVRMGNIKEGDIVLTWKRKPTKVLKVFPQGIKDIYTVTFEDGRKAQCCEEHLWTVLRNGENELITLQLKDVLSNGIDNFKIPLMPNLLSTFSMPKIEQNKPIIIDQMDEFKTIYRILDGKTEAHIKVLSENLTNHIQELVRKSGGYCKVEECTGSYNIHIDYNKRYLGIKSIEKTSTEEAQCILIEDEDHLYVTDDYVVTHNTFSSLALSVGLEKALTIIICPLNTSKEVWVDSIAGEKGDCVFKEKQPYWMIKDGTAYSGQKYIICHYEALDKLYDFLKTKNKITEEVCFIVDESHNLASADSKRTLMAIECVNLIEKLSSSVGPEVFLLSGTPLKSSFREMINISKFIDPLFTRNVENRFLVVYKSPNEYFSKLLTSRYTGYSVKVTKDSLGLEEPITQYVSITIPNGEEFTLESIGRKLREFYNSRLEEIREQYSYYFDVYTDLKNKSIATWGSGISSRELSKYEEEFKIVRTTHPSKLMFLGSDLLKNVNNFERKLMEKMLPDERKVFAEAKTIVKYPELKVQGEALGKIVTGNRIACHAEMAKHLQFTDITNTTTKKTVVFSSYVEVCKSAFVKCSSEKLKPIGVFGDSVKDLNTSVGLFTNNKQVNPIIATYKSLSTGVPLIAGNVVICLDLPFRMYIYNQAISRVWRLGQDQQVYIYILSLNTGDKPNINSRNIDIITFFKNEIEKITGYKSNIDLDSNECVALEDYAWDEQYRKYLSRINRPSNIFDKWSE